MKMRTIFSLSALLFATPVMAGTHTHEMKGMHDGGHSDHKKMDMKQTSKMFLVKKNIDGYDVSFHVMKAQEGNKHGGTHNLMVKVTKDGKVVTDLVLNSKVIHPSGKEETKPLMKMGDWLMAGYDLGHDGKHQVMTLFKTSDGKKHFGGIYYPQ
jgi:hypothetical protein